MSVSLPTLVSMTSESVATDYADDDLEKYFLQDIDDLGDEEVEDDKNIDSSKSYDTTRHHSPRYREGDTEDMLGDVSDVSKQGKEREESIDNPDWKEFLESANVVRDKLVDFETTIIDDRGSSAIVIVDPVESTPVPLHTTESGEMVDSETISLVAVVLEDMLLSLEQLWETMFDKHQNTAAELVKGLSITPPGYNEFEHLTIIGDDEEPVLEEGGYNSSTAHVDNCSHEADNIINLQKAKKIALQVCVNIS